MKLSIFFYDSFVPFVVKIMNHKRNKRATKAKTKM